MMSDTVSDVGYLLLPHNGWTLEKVVGEGGYFSLLKWIQFAFLKHLDPLLVLSTDKIQSLIAQFRKNSPLLSFSLRIITVMMGGMNFYRVNSISVDDSMAVLCTGPQAVKSNNNSLCPLKIGSISIALFKRSVDKSVNN